jgi:hypothetical protein
MTSQAESTALAPPTSPAISSTFRQTLLWRFESPEHARILDQLGEILWEAVNETHQWGQTKDGEGVMRHELAAVAGELRHAARYLEDLADEDKFSIPLEHERHLSRKARKWSLRVLKFAKLIEGAIAE